MNEKELRQLFKNQSDCYADTNIFDERGKFESEGIVIQAMTEDRFIEVLKQAKLIDIEYNNGIPYEMLSDSFKKSINDIEESLNKHKEKKLIRCQSGKDGECNHPNCPQIRDGEPEKTGRSCPLPHWTEDDYY